MFDLDGPTLRKALHEHFDAVTLAQGDVYCQQQRVADCEVMFDEDTACAITADVHGSKRKPYLVDVDMAWSNGELEIETSCSCPQVEDCKHAAAVLLNIAQEPEEWFGRPAGGPVSPALLTPFEPPASASSLDPNLVHWLQQITPASDGKQPQNASAIETWPERLIYILQPKHGAVTLDLAIARRLKSGQFGQPRAYQFHTLVSGHSTARYVRPSDVKLARKIKLAQPDFDTYEILIEGEAGVEVLEELLATGRCYWRSGAKGRQPLRRGAPRSATPQWNIGQDGTQRSGLRVEPPANDILPVTPPWYVDETASECGPIETGLPAPVARAWLSAPAVSAAQANLLAVQMGAKNGQLSLPPPQPILFEEVPNSKPTPCLRLYSASLRYRYGYTWGTPGYEEEVNFARLEFDYADTRVPFNPASPVLEHYAEGKLRRIHRDSRTEQHALGELQKTGLQRAGTLLYQMEHEAHVGAFAYPDEADWMDFVLLTVPRLRQQGWIVDFEDSFRYRLVQPDDWYSDAVPEGSGNDWFGVELGVEIEGEKINLLPVLLDLVRNSPNLLNTDQLATASDQAVIPVPLPDGRRVLFPAQRARQMLGVLLELLNPDSLNRRGQLRLPKLRAIELAGEADWRWLGASELRELSGRLRNFSGIQPVAPSPNLRATLRPYQQDGLNWLQFLREYELAGVLADDMGLGKTVQALAHLLFEKQSGRMDRPSLVVAPTSLMTNWRQETERFAPDLRVLVLHGLDRKKHFARIPEHDLVITSYPLLPRDQEYLLAQEYHYLILDEAQFIKNPKTQYAQVACALNARHHLCLTGTPMENHLGELWSLFHFLLPGFLGDEIRFNSLFRRPIEKGRNDDRRKLLARRVAPFILRRKKEEVVKELPPKTEIVQNVELSGPQRDLYESVRLAMHQRVKEEVDKKGLSRAHIIILDALLKLRQICCHPRLLKLPSAQKVRESAKLELLLDLIPEMIAEGRRILLFSQFTSMLALIQEQLAKAKIPYVLLTGDTQDRATPVATFQSGKVPLFLISLKAGGTGLNLTAADTVIHYDPWWNPAVENQATDRAHRIGQDKNVFVYKLMTVGTVEEKIAAMQARKRELVEGLLNEERPDQLKLSAADLDVLFAPLN